MAKKFNELSDYEKQYLTQSSQAVRDSMDKLANTAYTPNQFYLNNGGYDAVQSQIQKFANTQYPQLKDAIMATSSNIAKNGLTDTFKYSFPTAEEENAWKKGNSLKIPTVPYAPLNVSAPVRDKGEDAESNTETETPDERLSEEEYLKFFGKDADYERLYGKKGGEEESTSDQTGGESGSGSVGKQVSEYLKNYLNGDTNGAYTSAVAEYLGTQPFQYNPQTDAMYQSYLATMDSLGQRAMKDTMGQAAALSGGYGSSYAQNVGNQAYNQYLEQANANLPSFYNMAYNQYNANNDLLKDKVNMIGGGNANGASDTIKESVNDEALKYVKTGDVASLDEYIGRIIAQYGKDYADGVMSYLEQYSPKFTKTKDRLIFSDKFTSSTGEDVTSRDIKSMYGLTDAEYKQIKDLEEGKEISLLDLLLSRIK